MADEMMTEDPAMAPEPMDAEQQQSDVIREEPNPEADRRALVKQWQAEIMLDKAHFDKDFKRMQEDVDYARYGANKAWRDAGKYTVPIITQHIANAVASLYAKNPRAQARPRKKLLFKLWDGKPESAQMALQMAMGDPLTGTPPDPESLAMVQEISEAKRYSDLMDKFGKTMELTWDYYTNEASPNFKAAMKKMVRRAKTCGVGYTKLGYQRIMEEDPDVSGQIADMTRQLNEIESMTADAADGKLEPDAARAAQLKLSIADLQEEQYIILREGPTFDWPLAWDVIPHRACRDLLGFIGADYVTHEFSLNPETIQRIYKVDVRGAANAVALPDAKKTGAPDDSSRQSGGTGETQQKSLYRVWEVHDKLHNQEFTIVEGYPDFVREPKKPDVCVEGFWRIFPLTFNDAESPDCIFPLSDVYQLRHPQDEFNRARQGLREHRNANRPKYFMRTGTLQDEEKAHLISHEANAIIELNAIDPSMTPDKIIQPHKPVAIDPAQYETNSILQDVLVGVGSQEANLGPTSGDSATEVSVAEQGRQTRTSSNVDDLDTHLSDVARAFGQVILEHLQEETVLEICGPGAVWPEMAKEDIQKEMAFTIRAGSSGRPNQAAELANMERGMQYLVQLPGIPPAVLGRKYAELLNFDPDEFVIEGLPSITAINAMMSKMAQGGAGPNDPNAQGPQGGQNAEKGPGAAPGSQPAMPPPGGGQERMESQAMAGGQG